MMKNAGASRKLFVLLFAVCVTAVTFLPFPPAAYADEPGTTGSAGTAAELEALLVSHTVTSINLTADITVSGDDLNVMPEYEWPDPPPPPKTINMGDYGIILKKNLSFNSLDVSFTGTGASKPLFSLQGGSLLSSRNLEIVATAASAVAVQIDGTNEFGNDAGDSLTKITANGADAVGVHILPSGEGDTFLVMNWLVVRAEGAGGIGILDEGANTIDIRFSALTGQASSLVSDNSVFEEASSFSPAAEADFTSVNWTAIWNENGYNWYPYSMITYGYWLEQGKAQSELNLKSEKSFSLDRAKNTSAPDFFMYVSVYDVPLVWSQLTQEQLNTPGRYTITATPYPDNAQDLNIGLLKYGEPVEIPVHITDPQREYLKYAIKSERSSYHAIQLYLQKPMEDGVKWQLFYSEKTGSDYSEWAEVAQNPEKALNGTDDDDAISGLYGAYDDPEVSGGSSDSANLVVRGADLNKDYRFCLRILSGTYTGTTNNIVVFGGDAFRTGGSGGDRDGGDTDDQGDLPPIGGKKSGNPNKPPVPPNDTENPQDPALPDNQDDSNSTKNPPPSGTKDKPASPGSKDKADDAKSPNSSVGADDQKAPGASSGSGGASRISQTRLSATPLDPNYEEVQNPETLSSDTDGADILSGAQTGDSGAKVPVAPNGTNGDTGQDARGGGISLKTILLACAAIAAAFAAFFGVKAVWRKTS